MVRADRSRREAAEGLSGPGTDAASHTDLSCRGAACRARCWHIRDLSGAEISRGLKAHEAPNDNTSAREAKPPNDHVPRQFGITAFLPESLCSLCSLW